MNPFTKKGAYIVGSETPAGRYIDNREKKLLLHLLVPTAGERILNISCGLEDFHTYLRGQGCQVTKFELDGNVAIDSETGILTGQAEDLPFSDNEFDIVTLIASLEFTKNPQKAIMEAVRVSRGRVFIGVQNRYSLAGTKQRINRFLEARTNGVRFFSIGQLKRMIRNALGGHADIKWGSVIFLPYGWYSFAEAIEENIPVFNNPFGAFLGLSFSVVYRYRTIQERISPFKLGIKSPEVPGTVRAMQKPGIQPLHWSGLGDSDPTPFPRVGPPLDKIPKGLAWPFAQSHSEQAL